eukprot:gene22176-34274_t
MEAQAAVIVSGPDTAATSATALHLIAAAHLYSSISPVLSRDWLAHASAIATAPTSGIELPAALQSACCEKCGGILGACETKTRITNKRLRRNHTAAGGNAATWYNNNNNNDSNNDGDCGDGEVHDGGSSKGKQRCHGNGKGSSTKQVVRLKRVCGNCNAMSHRRIPKPARQPDRSKRASGKKNSSSDSNRRSGDSSRSSSDSNAAQRRPIHAASSNGGGSSGSSAGKGSSGAVGRGAAASAAPVRGTTLLKKKKKSKKKKGAKRKPEDDEQPFALGDFLSAL